MTEGRFHYPTKELVGDYLRAAGGLAITALPLAVFQPGVWVGGALGLAALLFAAFGLRTLRRQFTTVEVDGQGIREHGPFGGAVAWERLSNVRLSYYATRRDRRDGWMQMRLKGEGSVTLESSLDGFDLIAERVAEIVRHKRLALSETTLRNFAALGIDADSGVDEETRPFEGAS